MVGLPRAAALSLVLAVPLAAQAGDKAGEPQADPPADLEIPAAPPLSPEDELATFAIEPGYEIQLVAAEPLVVDPVVIAFDEHAALWVCEMRGYMPDVDGTGEEEPVGEIAKLVDHDGDGRMDERVVFMDELVLPRAILPYRDGLLAIVPPDLLFCRDTDGDGRADSREVVTSGIGGITSPEHAPASLTLGLDNWVHLAKHSRKYRFDPDTGWRIEPDSFMGQWGLAIDDEGRFFYDTNSDPLRGDLFAARYAFRNPDLPRLGGIDVRIAHDFSTWPSRITPGVNRGYQPKTLRDDFTLRTFTASCGPVIYRGARAPELAGDAFVCEPSGNLLKRFELRGGIAPDAIGIEAVNVYAGREFLTSTDERFRPVELANGPDGGLYVVDFYRGIIQHKVFVTSFLRRQIEKRGLATPIGLGRIWRIVPSESQAESTPDVNELSFEELVALLSSPSGFWRDCAQRLIVAEGHGDGEVAELLGDALRAGPTALGRVHALWCLEGIGWLTDVEIRVALADPDERVVRAGLELAEPWLGAVGHGDLVDVALEVARSKGGRLRHQSILSLGAAETERARAALLRLASEDVESSATRTAIVSGLHGSELAFLRAVLETWESEAPGRAAFVQLLARTLARSRREADLEAALALGRESAPWTWPPLFAGLLEARPKDPRGKPGYLRLNTPTAFDPAAFGDEGSDVRAQAEKLLAALAWPGRPGLPPEVEVRPLTETEMASFTRGEALYASICAACHQLSGRGAGGTAPPLRESSWVLGSDERLARILLHGMEGEIERDGRKWDMEMPALAADDRDIADVLTYVRRVWGHGADPVLPETVRLVREGEKRTGPWQASELEAAD